MSMIRQLSGDIVGSSWQQRAEYIDGSYTVSLDFPRWECTLPHSVLLWGLPARMAVLDFVHVDACGLGSSRDE